MTEDLSFEVWVSVNWKGPGANVTVGLIMIVFSTQSRQLPGDAGKLSWDGGHVEDPEQAGTGGKAAAHRWEVSGLCHHDINTSLRGWWSLSSWHHHLTERWVVFVIMTSTHRWEVGGLCHRDITTSLRGGWSLSLWHQHVTKRWVVFVSMTSPHRWEVGGLCHRDIITLLRGGWSLSSWLHHIAERWVVFVIVTWTCHREVCGLCHHDITLLRGGWSLSSWHHHIAERLVVFCHHDIITSLRGRIFVMASTHHWQVGVG